MVRLIVGVSVALWCLGAVAAEPAPIRIEEALKLADERHPDLVALRVRAAELQTRAAAEGSPSKSPRARMLGILAEASGARLDQRRAEVAAEVRASIARSLAARHLAREADETRTAFSKLAATVEVRRSKGTATELDVERSKLALVLAGQERSAADRRLAQVSVPLLTALGAASTETLHIRGDLRPTTRDLGAVEAAQQEALRKRSDLRALELELEAARLAPAGGGAAGDRPLSRSDLESCQEEVAAAKERIRIEVAAAGERVLGARSSMQVFDVALAPIPEIRERALTGYQEGALTLESAIGTLRDAFDARAQYILALEELAVAQADYDRSLGRR